MEPGSSTTVLVGSGSHSYDANGNTISDAQGRSFTWDFENRLTQAVNPGVGTTTFRYDPFGGLAQTSEHHHETGCPRLRDFRSLGIPAACIRNPQLVRVPHS
jgi:YD repeat-containing protein